MPTKEITPKSITKKELLTRIEELEEYRVSLEEEVTHLKQREGNWRRRLEREHKRTAATNTRNAELLKKVRSLDWEKRTLEGKIAADVFHSRRADVLAARLTLIKDISDAPLDDWIAVAADKTVAELSRNR